MYGVITLLKLSIVIATVGWLLLRRLRPVPFATGWLGTAGAGLLIVAALVAYLNAGRLHGGVYFHNAEFFHYYLNTKYFDEVGYYGLYAAALQADAESPDPGLLHVEQVRELRSAELRPREQLMRDPAFTGVRGRFSDERWASFGRDLSFFLPHSNEATWRQTLADHGYNGPPSLTALLGPMAALLGPASNFSVHAMALLDLFLVASMLTFIGRSYGLEAATLGAVLLGADLSGYDWIGGSPLRYLWLVLAVAGVTSLERERFWSAGFVLGAASLLRLFPALFALSFLVFALWRGLRQGGVDRPLASFVGGLLAAVVVFVGASLGFGGGIEAWTAYVHKIGVHAIPDYGNNVSLRSLLGLGPAFVTVALPLVGMTLVCLTRVSAAQAAVLGSVFVFVGLSLPSYYYGFLVLLLLWRPEPERDRLCTALCFGVLGIHGVGLVVRLLSPAGLPLYDPTIYQSMSGTALLVFFALLVHVLRDGSVEAVPARPVSEALSPLQ